MLLSTKIFVILTAVAFGQIHFPGERHLYNIRQLTFGGQNAEGYFSFDGKWLIFQASGLQEYGTVCDQIYKLDLTVPAEGQIPQRISTGIGTCTCSYFYPDDHHQIYAGTFQYANFSSSFTPQSCPEKACMSERAKTDPKLKRLCNTSYTWDLFPEYDIFKVNEFGTIISRLTNSPTYDAEGAVSPDGQHIVFTSLRSGDPEIWIMNSDGTEPKQLTHELGYDGGPFFSPNGKKIVFRASRPKTAEDIKKYKDLLSYNLVSPLEMELYTMNIDGSELRKVTSLGGANWAPFYLPDNRRIIFSSNFNRTGYFGTFDLYVVDETGGNVERVTFNEGGFDAFPMFDRAGQRLVWASSRNARPGKFDLNLFIAEWHENVPIKLDSKKEVSDHGTLNVVLERNRLEKNEQLTTKDFNSAPSFSPDDKRVIYEGYGLELYGTKCEQIFDLELTSTLSRMKRLSTGIGAAQSASYLSDYKAIFASNILSCDRSSLNTCPKRACTNASLSWLQELCERSYIVDLFAEYELFTVNKFGNFVRRLTNNSVYDGEAAVSSDEKQIVFTSSRSGDPDLWIMNVDGSNAKQLTNTTGYEGGAKFSPDGHFIVFHASYPKSFKELTEYGWLLWGYNAVKLDNAQIYLMSKDGKDLRQITKNGTNLWPSFVNNKQIVFASSNYSSNEKHVFNIFTINIDESNLKQTTFDHSSMNLYPTVSRNEQNLLWSKSTGSGQLNLYLSKWKNTSKSDRKIEHVLMLLLLSFNPLLII